MTQLSQSLQPARRNTPGSSPEMPAPGLKTGMARPGPRVVAGEWATPGAAFLPFPHIFDAFETCGVAVCYNDCHDDILAVQLKRFHTMMRTSTLRHFLALSLLALSAAAGAQTPGSAPPKLEKIDEAGDSAITVTGKPDSEKKITEKREQGRVTEVKVKSGKSTYYLKPNTPAGSAQPGDVMGSANRGPQWKVMEFNLGKKKKSAKEQDAADDAPAPPPAPAPAAK